MSRLLRKRYIIALLGLVLLVMFPFVFIPLAILFVINRKAYSRNVSQLIPFGAYSDIRNVDVLIIGDMIDSDAIVREGQSYVQVRAPHRNLESSFEILRHTHSILKDKGGLVVIALKEAYMFRKGFSVFDVPFFHRITIERYGLERLNRLKKYPVLFSPIASLKLAMNLTSRSFTESECPSERIMEFCNERGYSVKILHML